MRRHPVLTTVHYVVSVATALSPQI